jgi:hypothetical protein
VNAKASFSLVAPKRPALFEEIPMRVLRSVCLFLSLLIFVNVAAVEDQPRRDPQAVAVLQQAVAALGGEAAYAQVRDAVTTGMIGAAPGSTARSGNFVWKVAGDEFRREFRNGSSEAVTVSGLGSPTHTRDGKSKRIAYHVVLASPPLHLPGLVLYRQLASREYSIKSVGTEMVAGRPAVHIQTCDERTDVSKLITVHEWFFDAVTGLPLRVEYRIPDTKIASDYMEAAAEFSDFRAVNGLLLPFQINTYHSGQARTVAQVSSVAVNGGVNPAEFAAQGEK